MIAAAAMTIIVMRAPIGFAAIASHKAFTTRSTALMAPANCTTLSTASPATNMASAAFTVDIAIAFSFSHFHTDMSAPTNPVIADHADSTKRARSATNSRSLPSTIF